MGLTDTRLTEFMSLTEKSAMTEHFMYQITEKSMYGFNGTFLVETLQKDAKNGHFRAIIRFFIVSLIT